MNSLPNGYGIEQTEGSGSPRSGGPPSSSSAPKGRNLKRVRLTNLIRERAEKKKALEAAEQEKPAIEPADSKEQFSNKIFTSLPTTDPRYFYSRQILDAINSCDVIVLEEALKKYCLPDVISSHLYIGELKHNPLGPNSRILVGHDAVMDIWRTWFKIAPDSVFIYSNIKGVIDKKTGIATSTTNYTCLFTRVLEGNPQVSDEELRRVEALKKRVLSKKQDLVAKIKSSKSARLARAESSSNDALLAVIERNTNYIAQWRHTNGTAKAFLQETLTAENHTGGSSHHASAGGSSDSSPSHSSYDDIFGDSTEAEIEYLLDSLLGDDISLDSEEGEGLKIDDSSSSHHIAGNAKGDVNGDMFHYHPDHPQALPNPLLAPASSLSSTAPTSTDNAETAQTAPPTAEAIEKAATAAYLSKPLKPLPKDEIVTYTYHGTFSVEINSSYMVTNMDFSFAINIEKSGGTHKAI